MSADYFPLALGNKWTYQVKGEATSQAKIEVISYDTIYTVLMQGEEVLMDRREGEVNLLNELTTTYLGERISFGTIRESYLKLPFIKNDSWEQRFELSTIYTGDTVYKTLFISVDSIDITTLTVPSGKYNEVYCLRRMGVEDDDSTISYEWYAPNIGLVRKEIPADSVVWELEDFTLHEE